GPGGAGARWAMAGRNAGKLAAVRDRVGAKVDLIEADVGDAAALERVARSTRVVLTTVGPYARHGEPVVRACVEGGADYVDITGEPAFVDGVRARWHEKARERGVRLVSCCGF